MSGALPSRSNRKRKQQADPPRAAGPNTLVNKLPPGKRAIEATACMAAEGITANTVTVLDWSRSLYGEIDVTSLQKAVMEATDSAKSGDLRGGEAMLMAQALSLNAIFANLVRRALTNQSIEQFQMNLRFALKAQSQCRTTIEALAMMKNPPVFARQANIANGLQQVNNGSVVNGQRTLAHAEKSEVVPNELLEADGQQVDGCPTQPAGKGNQALAAVG